MTQTIFLTIILLIATATSVKCDGGMDFGDAMALVLGLTVGSIAILACLGKYARTVAAGRY